MDIVMVSENVEVISLDVSLAGNIKVNYLEEIIYF